LNVSSYFFSASTATTHLSFVAIDVSIDIDVEITVEASDAAFRFATFIDRDWGDDVDERDRDIWEKLIDILKKRLNCEGWDDERVSHVRNVEGETFDEEKLLIDDSEFLDQKRIFDVIWENVFDDEMKLNILLIDYEDVSCENFEDNVTEVECVVVDSFDDEDQWQLYHKINSVMFNLNDVDVKDLVLIMRKRSQRHRS